MNNSPKSVIVIFWSPLSFPVIQALPPKMTFTAKFLVNNILPDIVAAKPACDPCQRLVLHLANASPHQAVLTAQKTESYPAATQHSHWTLRPPISFSSVHRTVNSLAASLNQPGICSRKYVRQRMLSHGRNLKRFFSNGKRDCYRALTSMAPLSTQPQRD
jgi:hypothetical protein